jgi:hypothetical protein
LTALLLAVTVPICFYFVFKYFNNQYKQTNYYKNKFFDVEKFIGNDSRRILIPHDLEIINLGSNQPKFAFDYSGTNMPGMNWAMGPQSFEYDFKILKQFHRFLKEKAFVLIPVCPFSFFLYRYTSDTVNYKYYKFLDSEQINNYSLRTKRLHIDYPILTAKRNLVRLLKDVSPASKRLSLSVNPMDEKELKADAQKWMKGWLKEFSLNSLDKISLSAKNKHDIEKNITILSEMIDFCLERNYRPVIMMITVTRELSSLFPQSFVDEHILENIMKANKPKIPVFNYLNDNRFISTDLYFNSFFLNAKGRNIFTKVIVNDLKSL